MPQRGKPSGPAKGKIAFVGEAWGKAEAEQGQSFVGKSGHEFDRMIGAAGIQRSDIHINNVFMFRPQNNDITSLCIKGKQIYDGWQAPALKEGWYVRPDHMWHITALAREIDEFDPNLIIAMGNTPLWAICGYTGIMKHRGFVTETGPHWEGKQRKVLPVYHPAYILRNWESRTSFIADMMKARREAEFPEVRRPQRFIWLDPTIRDLWTFYWRYMNRSPLIAADVETSHEMITCVSFAPDPNKAIVIPFVDKLRPGYSYWRSEKEERLAVNFMRFLLQTGPHKILGQNFSYDMQYFWNNFRILCTNYAEDSMLRSHSQLPGYPKGLDFMASLHTNEVAWKTHRPRGRDALKRDE